MYIYEIYLNQAYSIVRILQSTNPSISNSDSRKSKYTLGYTNIKMTLSCSNNFNRVANRFLSNGIKWKEVQKLFYPFLQQEASDFIKDNINPDIKLIFQAYLTLNLSLKFMH